MITYFSGRPGSGKSVHLAKIIRDALRNGQNVIANFPFRDDLVKPRGKRKKGVFFYIPNSFFRSFDSTNPHLCPVYCLKGFCDNFHSVDASGRIKEGQTLLVFDECGSIWNSRTWQAAGRMEWLDFYSEHRKYGFDVYLTSQFERQIDRQIREQFEYEIVHKKVNNYKTFGYLLGLLCGGSLFVCVKHWYGIKSAKESRISAEYMIGRRSIYQLFNTSQRFSRT